MTESNKKNSNKKIQELLKKLNSIENKEVIKAINSLKIHGNATTILPLIELHSTSTNGGVKAEIESLLNTLKSTKAIPEIIDCLIEDKFKNSRQAILSSIWNSNLDYTPYFDEIISAAIDGDMMDAMECLTIFENIEGEITEEKILSPLLTVNQYLNDNIGNEDSKYSFLLEVGQILQQLNDSQ